MEHRSSNEKVEYTVKSFVRRNKVATVVIAVVLFFILVDVAGSVSNDNKGAADSGVKAKGGSQSTWPVSSAHGSDNTVSINNSAPVPSKVGDSIPIGYLLVTLTKVVDPAFGSDQFNTPDVGMRFVATTFSIVNATGTQTYSDDANSNVTVIGSDNQAYSPDFDNVSECTNFNNGNYDLTPGDMESGCVVFQLPGNVTVSKVQFKDNSGDVGQWGVN